MPGLCVFVPLGFSGDMSIQASGLLVVHDCSACCVRLLTTQAFDRNAAANSGKVGGFMGIAQKVRECSMVGGFMGTAQKVHECSMWHVRMEAFTI